MRELPREVLLGLLTAVIAAAILTPLFLALQFLMTEGLEFAVVGVISAGLLLAYLMNRETTGG